MCGIIGVVLSASHELQGFEQCVDALAHRGPDGRGHLRVGNVLLGHRRLAIIDLSDVAAQPMQRPSAGAIVFNGEIYDFEQHRETLAAEGVALTAHSDTEVLLQGLARHGTPFLRRLHGMYALAWLSPDGRRVVLARDHAGMKPLYVAEGPFGVAFASEVRALAQLLRFLGAPVRIDQDSMANFLAWGSVPEPATIVREIRMLPADCTLEIDVGSPRNPRLSETRRLRRDVVEGTAPREVVASVGDAVRRHLVADRRVAVFLSSGLDSAVIACEASRHRVLPEAITVRLASRGTDDEVELASELTQRLGIRQHVVGVDDWMRRLDAALDAYDQPSIDGLNTFVIASAARELGFAVALSGVGADEVFGGYRHMRSPALASARVFAKFPFLAPWIDSIAPRTHGKLRRATLIAAGVASGETPNRSVRRLLSEHEVKSLLPTSHSTRDLRHGDVLAIEQNTYLRDTLLRDTDVMGMASSVEIRAPFLDPEVIEAASRFGTDQLIHRGRPSKWVLRDHWSGVMSERARRRSKTGFTLDMPRWLSGPGRERVDAAVDALRRSPLVSSSALERNVRAWRADLAAGRAQAWPLIFALVQLAQQVRRWGEP